VRRARRGLRLIAVATGLATVLGACTTNPIGTRPVVNHHESGKWVISTGGTVTIDVPSVPANLNPGTPGGDDATGRMVMSLVWPSAFVTGPGLGPVADTNLVTSAEVVGLSPQTVVYRLNPRAVWSDGSPINAGDFKYLWQSHEGVGTNPGGQPVEAARVPGYGDIASIRPYGAANAVEVRFATTDADWEALFSYLLPAQVTKRSGWNDGFGRAGAALAVSGGPFEVSQFEPSREIVLERNPKWWGTKPSVKKIVVRAVGTSAGAEAQLDAGTIQMMAGYPGTPSLLQAASSITSASSSVVSGSVVEELAFNMDSPIMANQGVRQAVNDVLDRDAIAGATIASVEGGAVPCDSFLSANGEPLYEPAPGLANTGNLAAADRALTEAGWSVVAGRPAELHGKPVTLTLEISRSDVWGSTIASLLRSELAGLGIGLDVVSGTAPPAGRLRSSEAGRATGGAGAAGTGVAGSATGGAGAAGTGVAAWDMALEQVRTGNFPSQTVLPYSKVPGVASLASVAEADLSPSRAAIAWQAVQALLVQYLPMTPLFAEPVFAAWSSRLTGVTLDPGSPGPLFGAQHWGLLVHEPPHPARDPGSR